jgi:hypothetical protein
LDVVWARECVSTEPARGWMYQGPMNNERGKKSGCQQGTCLQEK